MTYNFDRPIDRRGTNTFKWDNMCRLFGRNDLLPFWVADMDFASPPEIAEAISRRADHGIFGYTFIPETAKAAFCDWSARRFGWDISPDWVSIDNGVMSSVSFAIQAFTNSDDGIIVPSPVYYPFFSVVEKNNRTLLLNPLVRGETGEYTFNFSEMESQMKAGAKMVLLCSPHNPVGRVWSRDELEEIGRLCCKYDVLVVSDEIHADLVLPGHRHVPYGSLSEKYNERAIICMAPSKTFNIPGLTVSQTIIPDEHLRKQYSEYTKRFFLEIKNLLSIIALETAYSRGEDWLDELLSYIRGNYEYALSFFGENLPSVGVSPLEGTYLMWIDFSGIDPEGCGKQLIEQGKVGLSDGALFGKTGKGFQRMNIACPRSRLEEGLTRISKALA